ncbi:deoxyguanosinetriphosphate triphosphohydrolase family protein, partial [Halomonas sp. AOP7-C1-8]
MDSETREFVSHKENEANKLDYRFYKEEDARTSETRTEFMRDYARVLYSSSFRRLQGKMQLLGVNETAFNRNRLTHSLEVSQIARGLAIQLGIKNTEVVETCSLIHDIGNPPFGHSGEVTLNLLVDESGGYEGNAQAFRVVRELEKKHPSFNGLNLTLRTLWGITKYFYSRDQNPKKFLYTEDYSFLLENLDRHGLAKQKSIDMQIMDLSDEIAYAAHDLEDALSSGLIVIGELVYEFKISDKFSGSYEVFKNIVKSTQRYAQKTGSLGSSEEYSMVFRKELTSKIVSTLMKDVGLVWKDGTQQIGYKQLGNLAL